MNEEIKKRLTWIKLYEKWSTPQKLGVDHIENFHLYPFYISVSLATTLFNSIEEKRCTHGTSLFLMVELYLTSTPFVTHAKMLKLRWVMKGDTQ